MKRAIVSYARIILLVSLLALAADPQFRVMVHTSYAQQSSSCPTNQIFRMTFWGGAPNSLNYLTAASASAFHVSDLLFYGVYPTLGPTGTEYWNMSIVDWIKHNSNYTQWMFNVSPGLKWSNGQNVTAQDILATYSQNYAFNSSYDFTGVHKAVVSEDALNSSTAVFNLNVSNAHFAETIGPLVLTKVVPAVDAKAYGSSYNFFGTPNVTGPFYPSNYQSGSTQMVLLRNSYFSPLPNICEIDANFVEGLTQTSTYLKAGTTDLAELDPGSVGSVLTNPNIHVLDEKGQAILDMQYNTTLYPLNETQFRQALAYGINQSQIVQQSLQGYGIPATSAEGTVPPIVTSLYNSNQTQYAFSPTQSTTLLQSIGITKGSDGFLQYPNKTDISLTIWSDGDSNPPDAVAQGIVGTDLQNLGFKVTTQVTSLSGMFGFSSLKAGSLYMAYSGGPIFANAFVDSEPGWDVYEEPNIASTYWMYPPSANAEYTGNYTAIQNTDNSTLENHYLANIQQLNSQYLPTIVLDYPDIVYGYNSQHWTNWPVYPTDYFNLNSAWDTLALARLAPVGNSSTTTLISTSVTSLSTSSQATSASSSSSQSSTLSLSSSSSFSSSSVPPSTTSLTGASSTSSSTSNSSTTLYAIAAVVVVIIVVAAVAAIFMRRRPPKSSVDAK